jgi:hypothetical protein
MQKNPVAGRARRVGEASGGLAMRGTGAGEGGGRQRFLRELNGNIQSCNRQRENTRTILNPSSAGYLFFLPV